MAERHDRSCLAPLKAVCVSTYGCGVNVFKRAAVEQRRVQPVLLNRAKATAN
jgi:hypothetical protein